VSRICRSETMPFPTGYRQQATCRFSHGLRATSYVPPFFPLYDRFGGTAKMEHLEGFVSVARGGKIYWQTWLPTGETRAVLIIVHGLAEHGGRYANLVNHFVPRGYAVYAYDHPGHGRSDGPRVYIRRFADLTDVLQHHVARIQAQHPDSPLFLIGHSFGALVAARFLLDRQDGFAGAVLSGSLVKVPDHVSSFTVACSRILSTLIPKAGLVGLDAAAISRDPEVVRAYLDDPLVYKGKTTARLGCEMLKCMQEVTAEAGRITLPILILHGGEDRLVDLAAAHMLHEHAGSADKTLIVYDGLHHEVYNEPEHTDVLADVEAWIDGRI